MGGGLSLDARLLIKKENLLRLKEAQLRAATEQSMLSRDAASEQTQVELNTLRLEAEAAKDDALARSEEARQAQSEVEVLRQMTSRLILTPEEKEEVVLKRCWLARYWLLAKHHGVHPEVAGDQATIWHGLAPLPVEVVVAAGQKAKDDNRWMPAESGANSEADAEKLSVRDIKDLNSDSNIESMFQVEKGLRDLAALKVEEGVLLAMAQHSRPSLLRSANTMMAAAGFSGGEDLSRLHESVELSEEEVEDVQFKQNWLVYYWRRAKMNAVEPDLADDRLRYWTSRTSHPPKTQDAVDAEKGLLEIRKLGLEQQLWDRSRAHAAAGDVAVGAASAYGGTTPTSGSGVPTISRVSSTASMPFPEGSASS
eukprot:TRINITY_DN143_c1_g1_i1.p1 TRINITY_DN143_c1_g1~~TRINITY_DN143_c1_g1_i1.p1  ORF type:complete len:368 (-),score=109.06 TRINITY_DN143_c1_g1_i1:1518-2621(-)